MAKNTIPARSRWPHESWFSTCTGYERPVDQRRTEGNESAESTAVRLSSLQLRNSEAKRQVHTNAPIAITPMNNNTKGESLADSFKLFDVTN